MECTQVLDVSDTQPSQRIKEDIVGYLGINGGTHPIKIGPNKIGRDPALCNIVIDRNSLSRQHAVINILSKTNFMVMDLGSRNKTKVGILTLQPYMPHPLKNGDTLQFGDMFGVFTKYKEKEDDYIPETQDVASLPETPICTKRALGFKRNKQATIPESPDVSDKDDSIVMNSQPVMGPPLNIRPRRPNTKSNESNDDLLFWNATARSPSIKFNLDDSESTDSERKVSPNIHDMETQLPTKDVCIYDDETQIPDEPKTSIHSLETQLESCDTTDSMLTTVNGLEGNDNRIHEMQTQLPVPKEDRPVKEIESDPNIHTSNTENNDNITSSNQSEGALQISNEDDELFVGFETQDFDNVEMELQFQKDSICKNIDNIEETLPKEATNVVNKQQTDVNEEIENQNKETNIDSIDKNETKDDQDDDETDCEDEIDCEGIGNNICLIKTPPKHGELKTNTKDETIEAIKCNLPIDKKDASSNDDDDIFENSTQNICNDKEIVQVDNEDIFDKPTQLIENIKTVKNKSAESNKSLDDDFFDQPTQIVSNNEEGILKDDDDNIPTQIICHNISANSSNEDISDDLTQKIIPQSPFKMPKLVGRKSSRISSPKKPTPRKNLENHYNDTQELLNDLLTQKDVTVVPDSQEDYVQGNEFPGLEEQAQMNKENNNKPMNFALSTQEIRDIICVKSQLFQDSTPRKLNLGSSQSDTSDSEVTPRKNKTTLFEMDLPNSQDINAAIRTKLNDSITDTSESENETQPNSEEMTPILYRKKPRQKRAKVNLLEALESESLPTRVMTRLRKPTHKGEHYSAKIFQSRLVTNQEECINEEIINENLAKLKQSKPKSKVKTSRKSKLEDYGLKVVKIDSTPTKKKPKETYTVKKEEVTPKKETKTRRISEEKIKKTSKRVKKSKSVEEKEESLKTRRSGLRKKDSATNSNIKTESKPVETRKTRSSQSQNTDSQKTLKSKTKVNREEKPIDDRETRSRSREQVKSVDTKTRSKSNKSSPVKKPRRSTSVSNESTIFEVNDSPRTRKRFLGGSGDESLSKRNKISLTGSPHMLRASTSRNANFNKKCVMFTAFKDEKSVAILEKLGATIVNDPHHCSVVVTPNIRRTVKLLCAVGLGRPIVGDNWLKACRDTNIFVDPWQYILKDDLAEKRYKFSLSRTLAGQRSFLKGMCVNATPSVLPTPSELKVIVECNGGVWSEGGCERWLCVSTKADRALWGGLKRRGAVLVTPEAILGGVFRQQLDIEANLIMDATD